MRRVLQPCPARRLLGVYRLILLRSKSGHASSSYSTDEKTILTTSEALAPPPHLTVTGNRVLVSGSYSFESAELVDLVTAAGDDPTERMAVLDRAAGVGALQALLAGASKASRERVRTIFRLAVNSRPPDLWASGL